MSLLCLRPTFFYGENVSSSTSYLEEAFYSTEKKMLEKRFFFLLLELYVQGGKNHCATCPCLHLHKIMPCKRGRHAWIKKKGEGGRGDKGSGGEPDRTFKLTSVTNLQKNCDLYVVF